MLEILSPAGSPEGVVAAVQNGADSIYLNYNEPRNKQSSKSFSRDDLGRTLEYCRIRGVKTYLSIGTFVYDRDLPSIAERAKEACRLGIDAIIIHDLGAMMVIKQAVPEVPIHASEKLGIHNLEGVKIAAAMGLSRVTVAGELSRKKIAYICRHSKIDIEVAVHGEQCICYGGNCYMSAFAGHGRDSSGSCSQPCQMSYNAIGYSVKHPLSLKDNCLIRYLEDLGKLGVTCGKIIGIEKRPEYSAIVTGIYSKTAHRGRPASIEDLRALQMAFSKKGFTDGYYADSIDSDMLGIRDEDDRDDSIIFTTARKNYLNGEFQRVPIRFVGSVSSGKKVKLAAADDKKNTAVVYGSVPEPAFHKQLTAATLQTQLHKTGGTPFYCVGVKGIVEPGLSLPVNEWGDMCRRLLADILEQRKLLSERIEGEFTASDHEPGYSGSPLLTVSVSNTRQISQGMADLEPEIVYVPVMNIADETPAFHAMLNNNRTKIVAALPRIIHDHERGSVSDMLSRAIDLGITDALAGNVGHIQFARSNGMNVRGDFGLNVYNSQTLNALRNLGLISSTLSFELNLNEIRAISKLMDTELIVYGRLPLMITESCISKNCTGVCTCESFAGLEDDQGALYPVIAEFGCRNTLLSAKKLFVADRRRAFASLGIWAQRLMFTTENALECVAVMKRYLGLGDYSPSGYTRGQYFKGVD